MPKLTIRPIQASDEPEWRRLWTLYLEYYESAVEEVVYQTTFERLLSGEDNEFRGFIAVLGDRCVGLTHYLFHRHCWRLENVCYLQDLYVDADVRGTSVGLKSCLLSIASSFAYRPAICSRLLVSMLA